MKTDLEKVESVQYHMDRIEEYLMDYRIAESQFKDQMSNLGERMLREVDYIDRFLSDKDICDKVCEDFLCKIKEGKELVNSFGAECMRIGSANK
jgi:hypothetical protein